MLYYAAKVDREVIDFVPSAPGAVLAKSHKIERTS